MGVLIISLSQVLYGGTMMLLVTVIMPHTASSTPSSRTQILWKKNPERVRLPEHRQVLSLLQHEAEHVHPERSEHYVNLQASKILETVRN